MLQFEQRANIEFMCKLGKFASETLLGLQQIYGDTALNKSAVYYWFSRFKDGQETSEDDQRSGRPSTPRTEEMIGKVRQLIRCDRGMTIADHTSLVVPQFLAEKNIPVSTEPPYSPDLAPSDFWLFPTLKMSFKGTSFATMEDIKSTAMTELWKIPKEAFHRCFQQW
ncbi:hypothetical protein B7P43_G15469 [Cryptotermes secundus]|uniref:Mos1 transposase HTH domain-containing protein n=1 Tax=Cryptotermes secundus TaxID=105785 RepID=A0A2J7PYG9_9NEOP|nr:hypothetical protein B7P43_G15469 [Cryptotermes secundus]